MPRRPTDVTWKLLAPALALVVVLAAAAFAVRAHAVPGPPTWALMDTEEVSIGDLEGHLSQGTLRVLDSEGDTIDTTPDDWRVQQTCAGDIDLDGHDELVLLAWRQGSFGQSHPFWTSEGNSTWTQHVFIVRWLQGKLHPVWMSSALGMEVERLDLSEGPSVSLLHRDGTQTRWAWGTWGLSLIDEGETADTPVQETQIATILVTGDIIAHESLCQQAYNQETDSYDFRPLFQHVRKRIGSYDLAVACQETPFVDNSNEVSGYPVFGTPDALGDALAYAGYDAVCAATNHAADKGTAGIAHTLAYWKEAHPHMTLVGLHDSANDPAVQRVEMDGMHIALLNATEHLNGQSLPADTPYRIDTLGDSEQLLSEVQAASADCDLVMCVLHTGDEYATEPSAAQRQAVRDFANAGADVVICTHSHVVLPMETITAEDGRQCVVYWGLGNLVSHMTEPNTIVGGAAHLVVRKTADGDAIISNHELLRTVSHFQTGKTSAYFLDDYTQKLAQRHAVDAGLWFADTR